MDAALAAAREQGGTRLTAAAASPRACPPAAHYVRPAIVEIGPDAPIVQQETFAPILYVIRYRTLDEAIAHPQRRAAGPVVGDLHRRRPRGRAVLLAAGSAIAASPT